MTFVAAFLEVSQLVEDLQQACIVAFLKDALECVLSLLGPTHCHHRVEINRLDHRLDGCSHRRFHYVPRLSRHAALSVSPKSGAVRHDRHPDLLLDHLRKGSTQPRP